TRQMLASEPVDVHTRRREAPWPSALAVRRPSFPMPHRDGERERRALAYLTLHPDPSAVELHELPAAAILASASFLVLLVSTARIQRRMIHMGDSTCAVRCATSGTFRGQTPRGSGSNGPVRLAAARHCKTSWLLPSESQNVIRPSRSTRSSTTGNDELHFAHRV